MFINSARDGHSDYSLQASQKKKPNYATDS